MFEGLDVMRFDALAPTCRRNLMPLSNYMTSFSLHFTLTAE